MAHLTLPLTSLDNARAWNLGAKRSGHPQHAIKVKTSTSVSVLLPIGSMYAIYGNIYHQYTPNVSIYIPYMDPMGYM